MLGPLLLGFIDDLIRCVESFVSGYADDTKFSNNRLTHHQIIQKDINNMIAWCENWLLTLNLKKCNLLHVGSNNP